MSTKLFFALTVYSILAAVAAVVLTEPRLKAGVLVLMAALACKTWIGELKQRSEQKVRPPSNPGAESE